VISSNVSNFNVSKGESCDEDDQERFFSVNLKSLIPPEVKNIGQSCIIHTMVAKNYRNLI